MYKSRICRNCGNEFLPKSSRSANCGICFIGECSHCGKSFTKSSIKYDSTHKYKYCSYTCYHKSRWGYNGKCFTCGSVATSKYCSDKCRKNFWDNNAYRIRRKQHQWEKKIELVLRLGSKCVNCGNNDIRVLDINHKDRTKKQIPKGRHYTWQRRLKDWYSNIDNLELLCANCHRIHTFEQMKYSQSYIDMANQRIKPYVEQLKLV